MILVITITVAEPIHQSEHTENNFRNRYFHNSVKSTPK